MAVRFNNRLSWFLPASCPHSVVAKYYGELQTQNQSPRHSPGLVGGGGGGGGAVVTND